MWTRACRCCSRIALLASWFFGGSRCSRQRFVVHFIFVRWFLVSVGCLVILLRMVSPRLGCLAVFRPSRCSLIFLFLTVDYGCVCGWCLVGAGLVASEWTGAPGSSGDLCTILTLTQSLTLFALFLLLLCKKILAKRLLLGSIRT